MPPRLLPAERAAAIEQARQRAEALRLAYHNLTVGALAQQQQQQQAQQQQRLAQAQQQPQQPLPQQHQGQQRQRWQALAGVRSILGLLADADALAAAKRADGGGPAAAAADVAALLNIPPGQGSPEDLLQASSVAPARRPAQRLARRQVRYSDRASSLPCLALGVRRQPIPNLTHMLHPHSLSSLAALLDSEAQGMQLVPPATHFTDRRLSIDHTRPLFCTDARQLVGSLLPQNQQLMLRRGGQKSWVPQHTDIDISRLWCVYNLWNHALRM